MEIKLDRRILADARFALRRADADLHTQLESMVREIRSAYQDISSNALSYVDDQWNRIVHNPHVRAIARKGIRAERLIDAFISSFAVVVEKIQRCVENIVTKEVWASLKLVLQAMLEGLAEAMMTQLTYACAGAVTGALVTSWSGPGALVGATAGMLAGLQVASAVLIAQGLAAIAEHVSHAYPAIYACYRDAIRLAWGESDTAPLNDIAQASNQFANGHLLLCAEVLNALPLLLIRKGPKGGTHTVIDTGKNGELAKLINSMDAQPAAPLQFKQAAEALKPTPKTGNGGKPAAAASTGSATGKVPPQKQSDRQQPDAGKPPEKKPAENIKCKQCPTRANPVNPIFGCKILGGAPDLDFALPGILPLVWQRHYASDNPRTGLLGQGWSLPISIALELHADKVVLLDPQHRRVTFPMPQIGQSHYSRHEQSTLYRADETTFELIDSDLHRTRFKLPDPSSQIAYLTAMIDRNGNTISIEHNLRLLPVRVIDCTGRRFALQFNSQDRLEIVSELRGQPDTHGRYALDDTVPLVYYEYNTTGDLIRVRNRTGQITREFAYHQHMMIKHAQPGGLVSEYEYSEYLPRGRVLRSWTNMGQSWTFAYGKQQTLVTDHLGRAERFKFDEAQRFTGQIDALGGLVQRQLDAFGNVLGITDASGSITRYDYDLRSRVTRITASDGATTTLTYDVRFDKPATVTDALGAVTTLHYDELANLIKVTDALGRRTGYQYDARGLPISITDAHGGMKTFAYDEAGLLTSFTDCSNRTTRYCYDREGNLLSTEDALSNRSIFEYDVLNRLIAATQADGSTERYEYDQLGRLTALIDAAGQRTSYELDIDGQPLTRTNAVSAALQYRYDSARRLTMLVNENGAAYAFAYDPLDRLMQETGFDGRTIRYRYDRAGRLSARHELGTLTAEQIAATRLATPLEQVHDQIDTSYVRDAAGRVVEKIVRRVAEQGEHSESHCTQYRYDAAGQMIDATNADCAVQMEYDAVGQLTAETTIAVEICNTIRHTYDLLGNRITTTLPDGKSIRHLFYGSGHLHQIEFDGTVVSDIERDGLHREINRTQGALSTDFAYDPIGRLHTQLARLNTPATASQRSDPDVSDRNDGRSDLSAPGSIISANQEDGTRIARRYDYDRAGNLIRLQDARVGVTSYQYDAIGRIQLALQPGASEIFAFDPAHNLIDASHDAGSGRGAGSAASTGRLVNNRLTVFEDKRYGYDTHGNLIDKRIGRHTHLVLRWNAQHQLIEAVSSRGAQQEKPIVQTFRYGYDPFGRRVFKHDEFGVTRFIWDGDRLLAETRGVHTRTYLYRPFSFVPIAQVERHAETISNIGQAENVALTHTARVLYLHTDHRGMPLELTDVEGNLRWTATYKAWGNVLHVEMAEMCASGHVTTDQDRQAREQLQPMRFQGQYFDNETGLHYNRFRYYDPDSGRFISQDPIGLSGGNNLYQYAPNPNGWRDPLGLSSLLICNCDTSAKKLQHRTSGPVLDSATGHEVGRIVVDSRGNAMIEPVGGTTVPAGKGGVDTHTLYPNKSNYHRLNPKGHPNNLTPHGHGHLMGTGPAMKGQGPSIDIHGNVVPFNSSDAHWRIN